MEQVLCSVRQAAVALSLGLTKTYELIDTGQLETVSIGTRRLVKIDSIRRMVENCGAGQKGESQ